MGTHDGHILPLLHIQHWFHNGSARRRGHNNVLWLLSDAPKATTHPHVVLAEQTGREKPRSAPKRVHITRFSFPECAQTSTHHGVCFPCLRDYSMLKIPRSAPKRAHITGFVCHACEPTAWLQIPKQKLPLIQRAADLRRHGLQDVNHEEICLGFFPKWTL